MFVDFGKAFDSVNRNTMLHILSNYGVPEEIAIVVMYDKPSCFVQTPDGPTEAFPKTAGIHVSAISLCHHCGLCP